MKRIAVLLLVAGVITAARGFDLVWNTTTSLPRASWRHACATANGFLYFMGGGDGPQTSCYYARINPDGTLGDWQTTTDLPAARGWFTADATANHIYACGGWNPSGLTNAVYYAPLDTSGPIGPWTSATALPVALYTQGGIQIDSCVYIVGGSLSVSGPVVADVRYARIQPDGSLGDWNATCALPQALRIMGVVAHDSFVYSVGGRANDGFARNVVYCAVRSEDGSLGAWNATTSLPNPMDGLTCGVAGDRIYALGADGGTWVYSAPFNPDGSLGAWQSEAALPGIRWAADGLAVNDWLYVTGGYDGSARAEVYYATPMTGIERDTGDRWSVAGSRWPAFRLQTNVLSGTATLRFETAALHAVRIAVIDVSGRVRTDRSCARLAPGEHSLVLPALEPGTYFARLQTETGARCARFEVVE
jgi:hypothetical protein